MNEIIKRISELFQYHNVVATMCKAVDNHYQICGSTPFYNINILLHPYGQVELTATGRIFEGQKLKVEHVGMHNVVECVNKFIEKGLIESQAHNITLG